MKFPESSKNGTNFNCGKGSYFENPVILNFVFIQFLESNFTIDAVDSMLPVMRDPDAYLYAHEWSGGILVGKFEPCSQ